MVYGGVLWMKEPEEKEEEEKRKKENRSILPKKLIPDNTPRL